MLIDIPSSLIMNEDERERKWMHELGARPLGPRLPSARVPAATIDVDRRAATVRLFARRSAEEAVDALPTSTAAAFCCPISSPSRSRPYGRPHRGPAARRLGETRKR